MSVNIVLADEFGHSLTHIRNPTVRILVGVKESRLERCRVHKDLECLVLIITCDVRDCIHCIRQLFLENEVIPMFIQGKATGPDFTIFDSPLHRFHPIRHPLSCAIRSCTMW